MLHRARQQDVANIALRFEVLRRTQRFDVSLCIRMSLRSRLKTEASNAKVHQ